MGRGGKGGDAQSYIYQLPFGRGRDEDEDELEAPSARPTPIARVVDVRTQQGMELVRTYLAQGNRDAKLKAQVDGLASIEDGIAETDRHLAALRAQIGEYRQRTEEIKAQIAALKGVKTAGALTTTLQAKLKEVGEKSAKATTELAALQEKALLARIELQDHAADLSLDDAAVSGLATLVSYLARPSRAHVVHVEERVGP